jgi:hypothetical protein
MIPTPTQKARQLVERYYLALPNNGSQTGICSTTQRWEEAKVCAEICCDEVLGHMGADRGYEFWTQVREEITKL